jgi:hypothetical protein
VRDDEQDPVPKRWADDVSHWPLATRNAALVACKELRNDAARIERFLVWGDVKVRTVRQAIDSVDEARTTIVGAFESVDRLPPRSEDEQEVSP